MNNPADQIAECLVRGLRLSDCLFFVPQEQIRARLDVSGEPRGFFGLVASAADMGGHSGVPGRILIDIAASVKAYTHLDEDPDGCQLARLGSAAMDALQGIEYGMEGWAVRFGGDWTASAPEADDSFRTQDFSATLFLQRTQPT